MMINKAYKFRIYPNTTQKEIINKTFGCTRFIYNYYLNKKQGMSVYECIKDIPNLYGERPYLKEIDSCSLRCALFDLDNSYNKFFKEKIGYPKYKSKYAKNSYRTNLITNTYKNKKYENIKLDLINKEITLPKLKKMKIRGYRNLKQINGRIINATVSRELNNKYYVSVVYEKVLQKYEKRIKMYQRRLSKKQKGSNNYYKLKQKLAKLHIKIKNARKYLIHHITKKITEENDIIVTENLKIKNMIKNHKLAKSLSDASLSEIIRQLEYKTKWKGKRMYKIDTYYPSSQICSKCGYKNEITKNLNVRNYECPNCRSYLDRDYNASENIMLEGLKRYMKEVII